MAHYNARTPISFAVLVALLSGCAHSPQPRIALTEPVKQPTASDAGVTAEDVQRAPNVPIEQLLQSKVAGVVVSRTEDGGIAIRIRGATTITGSNAPLYVIDGVPFQSGENGSLTGINPYDIASIKVLKEPADITMYGVRGANGVIVIKTKRSSPQ
jgi:TonB-dependent SusC/RagA subfamily outer membrane receptor